MELEACECNNYGANLLFGSMHLQKLGLRVASHILRASMAG